MGNILIAHSPQELMEMSVVFHLGTSFVSNVNEKFQCSKVPHAS